MAAGPHPVLATRMRFSRLALPGRRRSRSVLPHVASSAARPAGLPAELRAAPWPGPARLSDSSADPNPDGPRTGRRRERRSTRHPPVVAAAPLSEQTTGKPHHVLHCAFLPSKGSGPLLCDVAVAATNRTICRRARKPVAPSRAEILGWTPETYLLHQTPLCWGMQ